MRRGLVTMLALVVGLLSAAPSLAGEPEAAAPPAAPLNRGPPTLTALDATAWLDGLMPFALARGDIPGAVVVIVRDGQILVSRGYGVANVATGAWVDAGATLFRVGSVSKLFTWTAVMQLVEDGRLDLDVDVQRYLDFRLPPRAGKPITLRDLMTHTAGFEEAVKGIAVEDPTRIPSLAEAVRGKAPPRVYDAGGTPAYSNYGAALAGYIVERVSGERFDDYVARHIFLPLGMTSSTFRQPLPADLSPRMSKGYRVGSAPPMAYELVAWSPAGALATTGDDMARFMIAELPLGRAGEDEVLRPDTLRTMQGTSRVSIGPLNRMRLGYFDLDADRGAIGHDGDTVAFHALLALYPESRVGLLVMLNAAGKAEAANALRRALLQQFGARYFPRRAGAEPALEPAVAKAHAAMFAPAYSVSRRWQTSFMAGLDLLGQASVRANSDGTISVSGLTTLSGAPRRYREVTPFVWREVGGRDRIAAVVRDGQITRFSNDEAAPTSVFDATPAWRAARLVLPVGAVGLAIVALSALGGLASAVLRWRRGAAHPLKGVARRAAQGSNLASWLVLLAAAGWLSLLGVLMQPAGLFTLAKYDDAIHLLQGLTFLSLIGGLLVAGARLATAAVTRRPARVVVGATLVLVAMGVLTWFAAAAHLFGFSARY